MYVYSAAKPAFGRLRQQDPKFKAIHSYRKVRDHSWLVGIWQAGRVGRRGRERRREKKEGKRGEREMGERRGMGSTFRDF